MNLSIETRDFWATKGIDITEDHQCIHVISQRPLRTISSGIHGGGMRDLQHIVNFHVPETYDCADPKADLYTKIKGIGIDTTVTTGLMTAALLEDAGFAHVTTDDACLFAIGATQSVKSSMTPIEYTGLATAFGEQLAKTVYQACYETGQKYIEKIKNIIEY